MSNHRGRAYTATLGYRIHLGWRDRLLALVGKPLLVGVRASTTIRVQLRTDAALLVGGKPTHKGTTLEFVDTPPEKPDAQTA